MLQIEDLVVKYGELPVLHQVNLKLVAGSIVSLVGSNNAGKSTTLKALAGLLPASSGRILFERQEIQHLPAHKRAAMGITLVPEAWQLFSDMTVLENIEMGTYLKRKDTAANKKRLEELLEMFPVLKDKLKRRASNLSGGERQMVSMCRALISSPKLLLIDEPSMGLAPLVVEQVFKIIEELHRLGLSILLVEQNLQLALSIAQYGYVLENGVVGLEGSGQDLLKDDNVRKKYLGI